MKDTVSNHYHRIVEIEEKNKKQSLNVTLLQTHVEGNVLVQLAIIFVAICIIKFQKSNPVMFVFDFRAESQ